MTDIDNFINSCSSPKLGPIEDNMRDIDLYFRANESCSTDSDGCLLDGLSTMSLRSEFYNDENFHSEPTKKRKVSNYQEEANPHNFVNCGIGAVIDNEDLILEANSPYSKKLKSSTKSRRAIEQNYKGVIIKGFSEIGRAHV